MTCRRTVHTGMVLGLKACVYRELQEKQLHLQEVCERGYIYGIQIVQCLDTLTLVYHNKQIQQNSF